VEVALGGLEVRVAGHVAHGHGVEDARQERSGGVAQVVESQRWKARGIARGDESSAEGRRIEAVAADAREDVIVDAHEVRAA
jgi:hypothetical protein